MSGSEQVVPNFSQESNIDDKNEYVCETANANNNLRKGQGVEMYYAK
jgi:hypothetical protein